ncbi:MAG: hypothetical protein ABIR71_00485 [Chthoniobacterales bacterium]
MIDQEKLNRLAPLALQWAETQEALILKYGTPLRPAQVADAQRVGVKDVDRVRVLVVDRIPIPDDEEMADAARRAHVITDASPAIAVGHGIIIRADSWQNREVLVHALVHVAQCERSGGLAKFLMEYLTDRNDSADFSLGSIEDEARQLAREICSGEMATA